MCYGAMVLWHIKKIKKQTYPLPGKGRGGENERMYFMNSSMSVTFTFREKIILSGSMKKSRTLMIWILLLETLLAAAYALCQTLLIPNQTYILMAIRLAFLIAPLFVLVPLAIRNRKQRLNLMFPNVLTITVMHLATNMGLAVADVLSVLHPMVWWSGTALAALFMVAVLASMKGIIYNDIYTTCEMWEAGDSRFVLIEQKSPYFQDRRVINCSRLILPMDKIQACTLSENYDRMEITSIIVAPSWQPEESEYKDLNSFNAFPTTPVTITVIPRTEKDKLSVKAFHDALQT